MESGKCSDGRHKHAHGMSIVSEALHHRVDFIVVAGMSHDLLSEELVLINAWQLSVDKEESDLKESTLLCENLNRIPSVLQYTLVSIDKRDLADLKRVKRDIRS
jgi:hypothetical protein